MKHRKSLFPALTALCLLLLLPLLAPRANAAELDEILRYEITVDVNEDASLRMRYRVDWKVLDSISEGPLSWVRIGVPNSHCADLTPLSPAVSGLAYRSDGGGCVRVDLDRSYYAGEVAQIEFELVQDYMYQVDERVRGETVYHFTPGWFDDVRVDELTVRWNTAKAVGQAPACLVEDGYYTWTSALAKGEKLSVSVTYPNDAFAFDAGKQAYTGSGGGYIYGYADDYDDGTDDISMIFGIIMLLFIVAFICMRTVANREFDRTANFSDGAGKKITRTRVVYYPDCQGCGAPRPEGKDNCEFCGRSFIKSEEVITEEDIPQEEQDIRKRDRDGLYRYSSRPDTYLRIHVTHVPIAAPRHAPPRHTPPRGGGFSCAHSSCACACACACAGGGRAGCSTKDFYRTGLKLRQIARCAGDRFSTPRERME